MTRNCTACMSSPAYECYPSCGCIHCTCGYHFRRCDEHGKKSRHPSEFVRLSNGIGGEIEVDKKMIPLVKELRQKGLGVVQCSQEDDNGDRFLTFNLKHAKAEVKTDDNTVTLKWSPPIWD